jgi:hypothetical protein
MVGIKIFDNKEIDTSSVEIKEKVSTAIADYVKEHWNECVKITEQSIDDEYIVEFQVEL